MGVLVAASMPVAASTQRLATADRVAQSPGWWPTKGTAPRKDFLGPTACAACHTEKAATQATTAMARTASRATTSEALRGHPRLSFRLGAYSYSIVTDERQTTYAVTDGTRSESSLLTWAFGEGKVGQSFLFDRDGLLFESRVTYFDSLKALDFTPGRAVPASSPFEEAMARRVGNVEARRCFGCHTTASTTEGVFDHASDPIPGVTCEACHGPGRKHVEAMQGGRLEEGKREVMDPRRLDPTELVDFCGACHATYWDIALEGSTGPIALRSQPYRLQSSRCWGPGDVRITCTACHDPHVPLVREPRSYDRRCLACHLSPGEPATRERSERACKVGTESCVSCHMPSYEVPEMHSKFTDHLIRVVRPRDGTPAKR